MQVQVFHWQDPQPTSAEGWVVLDRIINSTAGGGIFMSPTASEGEVRDIAANMSKKFTVTSPQIGGAKAGIRFNPSDPRAEGVLKRFIKDHAVLLRNVWNTAGDIGTSDKFIEEVIQQELGLPTCQYALSARVASCTGQNLASQLSVVNFTPATRFFPLIEAAVGYGLVMSVKFVLDIAKKSLRKNPRVILQGFGTVGSSAAYYFDTLGIAKVVAISDKDGFIHCKEGLPILDLLECRRNAEKKSSDSSKTLFEHLTTDMKKAFNATERRGSAEMYFQELLACEEAEIVCPCGPRYQVTPAVCKTLFNYTWASTATGNCDIAILAAGANNCLSATGSAEDDGTVARLLQSNNVCVIPDYVCNSGTAQLFHRALSQRFSSPIQPSEVLEACAAPIREFLGQSLRLVDADEKEWPSRLADLAVACEKLSARRLRCPTPITTNNAKMESQHAPQSTPQSTAVVMHCHETKEDRERLLARMLSLTEECVEIPEMRALLESGRQLLAYDGFEPSGRMHVAQALYKTALVNSMTSAGFTFILWVADLFAALNLKQGGDMKKIRLLGEYFVEIWKACKMDMSKVKIIWASDEIFARNDEYFELLTQIATKSSLKRIRKCVTITGKKEDDENLQFSQLMYVVMQCADIFLLNVDVCQLGLDQRKVNMLARDMLPPTAKKPVILSHCMLPGLKKGQEKMSKSDPSSAVFMDDSAEVVAKKILGAYCEEGDVKNNPCLMYLRFIVFSNLEKGIDVQTKDGIRHFDNYESFEIAFGAKEIHPVELKTALTFYLNQLMNPVREHFANDPKARGILERVNACIAK
jgi:tyrosyl-tRNA synthetase